MDKSSNLVISIMATLLILIGFAVVTVIAVAVHKIILTLWVFIISTLLGFALAKYQSREDILAGKNVDERSLSASITCSTTLLIAYVLDQNYGIAHVEWLRHYFNIDANSVLLTATIGLWVSIGLICFPEES